MPMVGGKKYPYTSEGKAKAKKVSEKISKLRKEGMPQKQAVAVGLAMAGKKKKNI